MSKPNPEHAREAGLRYVDGWTRGIRRKRWGRGFRYINHRGEPVRDSDTLARITALVIPPAWRDVRISAEQDAHIQAVGRDARGRKQYLYHMRWTAARGLAKFAELLEFLEILPAMRRRVAKDLRRRGLPREKVLALLVSLLESTLIRVGSAKYARMNRSFGLTTLENDHLDETCPGLCLAFTGKRGKPVSVNLRNKRLVRLIKEVQELPGQRLFQYVNDEGDIVQVDSADLNGYLSQISQKEVTAKDYRTWGGTMLAAAHLEEIGRPETAAGRKRAVNKAVRRVAKALNNTPAISRKYYIHPDVIKAFEQGTLFGYMEEGRARAEQGLTELTPVEEGVRLTLRASIGVSAHQRSGIQ
ncbi:DNA topoisomerase-1 [Desulfonatronum thiosulfatophilum]|uniref:DNA topoisomerase-1 n=1 Tax=Desulfonatronum thiosulfatophilum TaxID=617002 RepID=A0A1G6EVR4_9BACT|nr:DNA topoisomerase IB [Desulfonatronum thiosulfatophilum]SDB61481.1 DNA topoisomerase-1 [Desulfonatronum thiosulfatophilum]